MPRSSVVALIPAPTWKPWLEARFSTIEVFSEVHPSLLEAPVLLLWDKYSINRKHVSFLSLWKTFFNIKNPKGKLGLMCDTITSGTQCVSLELHTTYSLDTLIEKLEPAEDTPYYPTFSCEEAKDIITRAITSHKDNNFRTALTKLRNALLEWEEDLFILQHKNSHGQVDFKPISRNKAMSAIEEALIQTSDIWEFNYCYFKFMPQYPLLAEWPAIQQQISNAIPAFSPEDWLNQKLSRLITHYLEHTISYITQFYHMEPYEKPKKRSKILIIDDQDWLFQKFQKFIHAHDLEQAHTLQEASAKLNRNAIDLAVVDLKLDGPNDGNIDTDFKGLDYIKKIKRRYPSLPVMVISAYRDIDHILTAGNYMADAYLWKEALDFTDYSFIERINALIKRKLQQDTIKSEVDSHIWGNSQEIHFLKDKVEQLATSRQSFLLLGGEGAMLHHWVHFLHHHSSQIEKELQTADLSHWTESDILAVLNGVAERQPKLAKREITDHSASQKTAKKKKKRENVAQMKGIDFLRDAYKHILYVPHFERLSRKIQSAFLLLMAKRNFLKVNDPNRLDIQFVFSSNLPKERLLDENIIDPAFISDFPIIDIPPLYTRKEDIKHIIEEWMQWKQYPPKLLQEVLPLFLQYAYPYNENELLHHLETTFERHRTQFKGRAKSGAFLYMTEKVTEASLPRELIQISSKEDMNDMDKEVAKLELRYVENALTQYNGDKSKAAAALNGRNTGQLHHLIKKYRERYPELLLTYPMIRFVYKIN